uniref:Uncharacterized protein n=1 Tax=Timema douglasi TaxID=61478 RepID=A0A7R8ZG94_TIMDO|nr:unnamed protein product [Timema douglasi]
MFQNFCSNYCYAAAKFLAKQLLTSPLWIHDKEEIPTFKLLPSTVYRNPAGEEVDLGVIRLDAAEKQRTAKPVDEAEKHSSNIAEIEEASDGYKDVTLSSNNILSHSAGYLNSSETVSGELEGVSSNIQIIENKVDFKNVISPNKGIQDFGETLKDFSAHKVSAFESEPDRGCEKKPPISTPTPTHGENTPLSQYHAPRNDRLQKKHTSKGVVQEPAMRSVVLRIETCLQEWFTVHTVKLLLGEDMCQRLQQLDITEETGPVLPLVDLHAQNALRRRIVLDRLNRVYPRNDMIVKEGNYFSHADIGGAAGGTILLKIASTELLVVQLIHKPIEHALGLHFLQALQHSQMRHTNWRGQRTCTWSSLPASATAQSDASHQLARTANMHLVFTSCRHYRTIRCVTPTGEDSEHALGLHFLQALQHSQMRHTNWRGQRTCTWLPEMLAALGLSDCDITTDVRELVGSFSLSAHNITFHPTEWNFLGLIIIHSLSIKNKTLRFQLNADKVKKYVTMILLSFEQDGNYLENLMAWLTEPYCVESNSK